MVCGLNWLKITLARTKYGLVYVFPVVEHDLAWCIVALELDAGTDGSVIA